MREDLKRAKCPVCSIDGAELIGEYRNKNKLFEGKELLKCVSCGLIFACPMPSRNELYWYYNNVWLGEGSVMSQTKDTEMVYRIQADERAKYLKKHMTIGPGTKVLDIGSGYGYLKQALERTGMSGSNYFATDPSPAVRLMLEKKGIKAYPDIAEIDRSDFDIAAACFVLEHVPEPLAFLKEIRDRLKKGGYLFVDVPERDDTFKPVLEPHVAVYTKESLKNVLERSGFRLIHLTGYGARRDKLIKDAFLRPAPVIRVVNLVKRLLGGFPLFGLAVLNKIQLYNYYKFNEEGENRWWIRAIAQKV